MKKVKLLSYFIVAFYCLFYLGAAAAQEHNYQKERKTVQSLVDEAAKLIKTKGQAGLDMVSDKNGKFNTKDTYVFVTSGETVADLVNPAFEAIEGLPAEQYKNSEATKSQMIIVNAVKDKDAAWVEYLWPKPNEKKFSKKISYLRKITVNNKVRIVGAGFYPDEK